MLGLSSITEPHLSSPETFICYFINSHKFSIIFFDKVSLDRPDWLAMNSQPSCLYFLTLCLLGLQACTIIPYLQIFKLVRTIISPLDVGTLRLS
jgi:hypothetical protein